MSDELEHGKELQDIIQEAIADMESLCLAGKSPEDAYYDSYQNLLLKYGSDNLRRKYGKGFGDLICAALMRSWNRTNRSSSGGD